MKYLFILLIFLVPSVSNGQAEDRLRQEAEEYFRSHPEERLFVHVAKKEVLAGEDVWFRIYHYSPENNRPIALSRVAYVELITPTGDHVTGSRIRMNAKGGHGYLSIPPTVNSGSYLVKVYTKWMQNFDPAAFFSTQLNVINTFKPLGLTSPPDSADVTMKFTPEGGDIIGGNTSSVGVLFLDGRGRGIGGAGSILSRDSVEVATFETDRSGMGVFRFSPEVGQSYRAVIKQDSQTVREFDLPAVRPRGISFRIDYGTEYFTVRVEEKGTVPGRRYLAILAGGKFRSVQSFASGQSDIRISHNELAEGVNQITLFNNEGEPVAERLVFRMPEDQLRIETGLNKPVFQRREKITLDLASYNNAGERVESDLSVSVIPNVQLTGSSQMDFETFLWLGSELHSAMPGVVLSDLSGQDIHKLLLIYGWRRYDWTAFGGVRQYAYLPELREPLISGSISGSEPATVYFGYPDTLSNIAVARTREDGSFHMETPNYFGSKEIILRHTDEVARELKIQPLFHSGYEPANLPHFNVEPAFAEIIKKQSENLQVENIFYGNQPASRSSDESYYGSPTVSYNLDDYTRFPVMEEVMREYVYGVYVRKRQGSFNFSVLDESQNKAMDTEPMILVDGIPGFTADEIMAIDPLKVRRIEVYRGKYGTGPVMSGGIIAFYTYKRDMAGVELSDNAIRLQYQGLQPFKQFFSPDHSDASRLPDFRTQLFWEPETNTVGGKATIEFFSSDIPGEYLIRVQGLGEHGYAGSATKVLVIE